MLVAIKVLSNYIIISIKIISTFCLLYRPFAINYRPQAMDTDYRKSLLELKVIWKDDHMIELSVKATNERYMGTTEVYTTSESLQDFSRLLLGYPANGQVVAYEAGEKEGYSFFALKVYLIDSAGRVGIEVRLEERNAIRKAEKDKVKLEIIAELSAIDRFQKELIKLATKQEGTVTLYGRNH